MVVSIKSSSSSNVPAGRSIPGITRTISKRNPHLSTASRRDLSTGSTAAKNEKLLLTGSIFGPIHFILTVPPSGILINKSIKEALTDSLKDNILFSMVDGNFLMLSPLFRYKTRVYGCHRSHPKYTPPCRSTSSKAASI